MARTEFVGSGGLSNWLVMLDSFEEILTSSKIRAVVTEIYVLRRGKSTTMDPSEGSIASALE